MQTFEERIKDETKSSMSDVFIKTIFKLAQANNTTPTEMWQKWQKHCRINEVSDQSPTVFEFIQWNKLKEVA